MEKNYTNWDQMASFNNVFHLLKHMLSLPKFMKGQQEDIMV
jgi:hypothetical protein